MKKKLKIPIYFGDLLLIQTNNFEKVEKKYNISGLQNSDACVYPIPYSNGYTKYLMLFNKDVTPSIVAHEAVHAVNFIFRDRDIELDVINDEPQAYLLGWIVKQCHNYLNI